MGFEIPQEPFNFTVPTFGGKFIWSDIFLHAGWRIQKNVLTGHCRLLDSNDFRQAWGTYEYCHNEFLKFKKDKHLKFKNADLILLLHGLGRHRKVMNKPCKALKAAGFEAFTINYPSTFQDIDDHADGVIHLLNNLEGITSVSFVCHSLGGLVAREILARDEKWQKKIKAQKIIMMGTPNQGAKIAEYLSEFGTFKAIAGPSGQNLHHHKTADIPLPKIPALVIAGGWGNSSGFNPLLKEDNDGIVTVAETRLNIGEKHIILPVIHTLIMSDDKAIAAMLDFLEA